MFSERHDGAIGNEVCVVNSDCKDICSLCDDVVTEDRVTEDRVSEDKVSIYGELTQPKVNPRAKNTKAVKRVFIIVFLLYPKFYLVSNDRRSRIMRVSRKE